MNTYSIKDVAALLKGAEGKDYTEDGIRKMVKQNRLPKGITFKKMGWQIIIFAKSDDELKELFTVKFKRNKV